MDQTRTQPRWQELKIVAQDPAVRVNGRILTAKVRIPAETINSGPWGHRAQVLDYDTSTDTLYKPCDYKTAGNGLAADPFPGLDNDTILNSPQFHAHNAFAVVMHTLARFERALGRRLSWGFNGHQIKVVPHAFAEANAYYSRDNEALLFGYFLGKDKRPILSSLSHDVVSHEATHALLDGLRNRYTQPSSPDQAAFHEGFSDIVALLSVFALPEVVGLLLDLTWGDGKPQQPGERIPESAVKPEALRCSVLLGLAEEMGQELAGVRGEPLRRSLTLKPSPSYYRESDEFREPHRRGEILVAAFLNAFVRVWSDRITELRRDSAGLDRRRVAEEGATAAERLLTSAIRAIDYCPPVHLEFGDFLSAVLTADHGMMPDDSVHHLRDALRQSFKDFGMAPASSTSEPEPGLWTHIAGECPGVGPDSSRCHFEPLQRDADEVFRFIWENRGRDKLGLQEGIFTRVESVRPCIRIGDDGFVQHETVAEYVQVLVLAAGDLGRVTKLKKPQGMAADAQVELYGGGALVFDEFGQAKLHIHNRFDNWEKQQDRLQQLYDSGNYAKSARLHRDFAHVHRLRSVNAATYPKESWL